VTGARSKLKNSATFAKSRTRCTGARQTSRRAQNTDTDLGGVGTHAQGAALGGAGAGEGHALATDGEVVRVHYPRWARQPGANLGTDNAAVLNAAAATGAS
jgi:hypothetical protein